MVKTEPVQQLNQQHGGEAEQQQYHTGALQQLDEQVEYDAGGYEDYGEYDGGYGNNMMEASTTDKGRPVEREVFDQYMEKSFLQDGRTCFKCTLCGKQNSLNKAHVRNHIESVHFPGHFSYNCNHCK